MTKDSANNKWVPSAKLVYGIMFICLIVSIVTSILYSKTHCQANDDACDKKNNDYKITLIVFWVLFLIIPIYSNWRGTPLLVTSIRRYINE